VFVLNLDMIGRNPQEPLQLLSDRPEALRRLVEEAAAAPPALPAPRLSSGREQMASDHAAFSRRGVPYLFFFTGLHPDYHGVDDEAERLDYPRLAAVIRLAWRVASLLSGPAPVP
jgi:Zn-dependent M28 family amino/carboxypeptidase